MGRGRRDAEKAERSRWLLSATLRRRIVAFGYAGEGFRPAPVPGKDDRERSDMTHPIIGLWKVTVTFGDKEFKTVQHYLPEGLVVIDAGIFVANGLWKATGARSARMLSLRPIVTGTLMDREFHGWQEVSAEAAVNEDDILVSETEFDAVDEDGTPKKGTVSTRGERVTLE